MKRHNVILDASVIVYHVEELISQMDFWGFPVEKRESILKAVFAYVNSCDWLSHIQKGEWNPVWVMDKKRDGKYWRHDYLLPHNISYKGGRKEKADGWFRVKGALLELLSVAGGPWKSMEVSGFEADDVAALLARCTPPGDFTTLATIDTDWMGLIVPGKVDWYSIWDYGTHGRAKDFVRHRYDMKSINKWVKHKFRFELNEPRDLWDYKAEKGDRSDNLPAGSPIEVIDLLNPPAEYDLTHTHKKEAKSLLKSKSTAYDKPNKALDYLKTYYISTYPH